LSRTVCLARADQATGDEHVGGATSENLQGSPAQGRAHRADCTTGQGRGPAQTVPAHDAVIMAGWAAGHSVPTSPMPNWLRSGHRVQRHVVRWTGPCGLGSTRATTQIAPEPVRAVDAQQAGLRSSVNIPTTTPNGSLARVRTPKPLRDFPGLMWSTQLYAPRLRPDFLKKI
jgi:hypothetical protein